LPKIVLTGTYDVDLKILADGVAVAHTESTLNVEKVGVAQFVATASIDHSLIYGLAAMSMASLTGWIASIAFRRG
jgi:Putative transmembrane protein (Alph_Pro_TM)